MRAYLVSNFTLHPVHLYTRAVLNSSGKAGDVINAAAAAVVKTSAGRSKTTLV